MRVTLLREGGLGDTLLLTPLCRALRSGETIEHLRVFCDRRWLPLMRWSADIDAALPIDELPLELLHGQSSPNALSDLFRDDDKVVWYTSATGAARVACRQGHVSAHDPRPRDQQAHIVEHLAAALGVRPSLDVACLQPHRGWLKLVDAWLAQHGVAPERLLVIHPGSGGEQKCLPWSTWQETARWAGGTLNAQPVFVVGPAEIERWPREQLVGQDSKCDGPLLPDPMPEFLGALLARARVYAGHDSGPSHLAGLLGRNTVAVFRATAPTVWRPPGPRVTVTTGEPDALRAAIARAWQNDYSSSSHSSSQSSASTSS